MTYIRILKILLTFISFYSHKALNLSKIMFYHVENKDIDACQASLPNSDAIFRSEACTAVDLERYTGKTICAIASVSSASITVKSPKRLHTYARTKNSTEQRNEQRVYRTSEIVRARNFSLPRVRPQADHSFFNLCLPYFVFFTLRFRLHYFIWPDLKLHSRRSMRRNRPSRN